MPESHEPVAGAPAGQRKVDAHLILALGVISVVICPVTGPVAWVMGNRVVAQVPQEALDEAGWKAVRTGRRLGILGTLGLLLLILMGPLLYLLYHLLLEQFSQW